MPQLDSRVLCAGTLVSVTDVRCRGPEIACGGEEHATGHQLVITRAGVFVRHDGAHRVVAEPTHALFFNRHQPYRVSHPVGAGDDCTVLTFPSETLSDVLTRFDPLPVEHPDAPFRVTHAPLAPAALLELQRLRHAIRERVATVLEIEERALGILASVASGAYGRTVTGAPRSGAAARRRHRAVVEATKLALASRPGASTSLGALARAVGCSPFHLARVFRVEVGLPVYQYALRLRLATALERPAEGTDSLSALALDVGFSSHSHFTTLFRRVYGLPPSLLKHCGRLSGRTPSGSPGRARAVRSTDS